jgi:hypothetical protein
MANVNAQIRGLEQEISRMRLGTHEPPNFKGKINESWPIFLRKFETWATKMNLTDDDRLRILPTYLVGPAFQIYADLTNAEKNTYVLAKENLGRKFVTSENQQHHQHAFQARRQKPGETIAEFADALQSAFASAYPRLLVARPAIPQVGGADAPDDAEYVAKLAAYEQAVDMKKQMIMTVLIENSQDEMHNHLIDKNPQNVNEAIAYGTRHEANRDRLRENSKGDELKILRAIEQKLSDPPKRVILRDTPSWD